MTRQYYAPPRASFERQIRLAFSKILTKPYDSGQHLERARVILGGRNIKSEKRILQAAYRAFVDIHQQTPLAWNGEDL